jgi:hypothetical protein
LVFFWQVNSNGSLGNVHAILGAAKVWGRREEEGIETAVFRRCTEVLGRNHMGFQQPAYACSCAPASFLAVENAAWGHRSLGYLSVGKGTRMQVVCIWGRREMKLGDDVEE